MSLFKQLKSKALQPIVRVIGLTGILLLPLTSDAFEMVGMISYNLGSLNPKPSSYKSSSDGIGYTFLGRLDLGPGQLESGFQFIPTLTVTQQTLGEIKATGSYWVLPLLYRFTFLPPFFSIAAGLDYAVVGTNNLAFSGAQVNGLEDGYRSHWGFQSSLEASQDLGENVSLVLDVRYRKSLGNAARFESESTRYAFWIVGLGIKKHLD